MSPADEAEDLHAVGNYDLVEKIADGGMGSVYRGQDRATGEVVAIKIVSPEVAANEKLMKRFEREFQTAYRLSHPNLVHSLALELQHDPPFLVMEFIDGVNLGARIEQIGALEEPEALKLIRQISSGLEEAHRHGIIHRDVKPDNILVSPDGSAKLIDFGLAKDLQTDIDLTLPGRGMGTPHFMAPEQLANAKNVDKRCDIYSLGASLYMMLAGIMPFQSSGPLITVFKKKAMNQLAPLRERAPNVSARTEAAILHAMEPEPEHRPGSCEEFVAELIQGPDKDPEASTDPDLLIPPRPGGSERRAAVRFPSTAEGGCHPIGGEDSPTWTARVQNLSSTGIGLLINRRFEPRTVLLVELQGLDQIRPRRLLARVVRVQRISSENWLIGCSFGRKLADDEIRDLQS